MLNSAAVDIRRSHNDNASPRTIVGVVACVALAVNALALSASQLWVSPDASYYVALAGGIADRLDFSNELFLIRPPGYPLMLALLFKLFGSASATAIIIVQHTMTVAVAVVIALIAWHLTHSRGATLLAGVMAACSLQLLAFANVIITEVPYSLAIVLVVYFAVRHYRGGLGRHLALSSLMVGAAYLLRPIGMTLLVVCVLAAIVHAWAEPPVRPWRLLSIAAGKSSFAERWPRSQSVRRRLAFYCALAIGPAAAVTLPAIVQNKLVHGADLSSRCASLALYHRTLYMDKLDSDNSVALADIRSVVAEAIKRGDLPAHADYRLWGPVWKAYERVRNMPLAQSAAIIGQAARDVIREHPFAVAKSTAQYSLWMLMVPDGFYRFHPGGAPGTITPTRECRRSETAEIYDVATYEPMLREWIEPYDHYISLESHANTTTPLWSGIARWFLRHIENGSSISGLAASPYEEFCWLCLIGVIVSLLVRERIAWLLVSSAVFPQVFVSAFLAGPTPRYAVPLKPLMVLYAALLLVTAVRSFSFAIGRISGRKPSCSRELSPGDTETREPSHVLPPIDLRQSPLSGSTNP